MSRRQLFLPAWAMLACLGISLTGCSEEEAPAPLESVNVANNQPTRTQNSQPNNQQSQPADPVPEAVDPEAGFPADLKDWTDEDFRKAREINHSRLTFAVQGRAGDTEDSADDAKFWLALLEIKPLGQGRAPDFENMKDPGAPDQPEEEEQADKPNNGRPSSTANDDPSGTGIPTLGTMGSGGSGGSVPGGIGDTENENQNENVEDINAMGKGSAQEIVKTLIDAALENSTDASIATLTAVLSGALVNGTPDDVMVGFALDGLKESKREDHQELMLQALLKPGQLRDGDAEEGSIGALELQKEVFDRLAGAKLSALKKTLAEGLADAEPATAADVIVEYLLDDNFDNLEAQVILYQSGAVTDDDLRAELRDLLASYSKSAFNVLMGLSEAAEVAAEDSNNGSNRGGPSLGGGDQGEDGLGSQSVGASDDEPIGGNIPGRNVNNNNNNARTNPGIRDIPLTDEQAATVASAMWTKDFEETVLEDIGSANSLEDVGDDMNLAGVLPMHGVRRKLAGMMENSWASGPQSLADQGVFTNLLHEPGMLLVSKTAKTDFPERFNPEGDAPTSPRLKERWDENKLKYDWFREIYNQVDTMRKLYAAAPAARQNFGNIKPPVRLHRGAEGKEEVVFEARWPDELSRKAGDAEVDPLKVQYIRLYTTDVLNLVKAHYKGTLRGKKKIHGLVSGGSWLTLVETDLEAGITRSIDIFIEPGSSLADSQGNGNGAGAAGGGGGNGSGVPTVGTIGGAGSSVGAAGGNGRGNSNQPTGVVVEMFVVETPAISD